MNSIALSFWPFLGQDDDWYTNHIRMLSAADLETMAQESMGVDEIEEAMAKTHTRGPRRDNSRQEGNNSKGDLIDIQKSQSYTICNV